MANYDLFTVMGPGRVPTPGFDMLLPPRLTTTTDKYKWRKQVSLWVTTVKRFAKGGDKKAKGILSALGLTLLNSLDTIFSSQVEQAINAGIINLDEEEDTNDEHPNKQVGIVNEIIDLVAKDSPTDGIRRLVQMMRNVFNCTRKNGESPAIFARRYQAAALDYLNHCDTGTIQQDSQNFAMILLENAKIPASVYSSVITRLVSTITSRSETTNKIFVISKDRLTEIRDKANALQSTDSSGDREATAKSIIDAVTATVDANELHVRQDRTVFRISLDDAVEVLKDLKVEDEAKPDGGHGQREKRIGSMLGKRDFNHGERHPNHQRYNQGRRKKSYIPSGQGPKAVSRCRNCKEFNHWYKDPECIYNVVKGLMEGKDIAPDVVQKLSPQVRNMFKDENGNFKSRVPVNQIIGVMGDSRSNGDNKDVNTPSGSGAQSNSYFR
ncbi:hypothetical protein BWQ96_04173 [Gracilariopsis chorda]|uniref:Uncharacterized protein n=1 Tax=Gracilariopsis chorda TaxID=448386 RepID=A0A2V3IVG0_9FLOR|nr:hypothetical protein BWQ96_04173 [Gracilariopsis chorda]|eukprot:PXF46073.1 hypothetical protein BWQ96_04173 [Gracilariopsis chorda]